nr:DEAD-box ATP-dependent RNA helicase 5 isoform X1 [Arachis hypogaea]XP_025648552.1 DEAD-box ATP-dependent RNA helicase 5 isoform X1 [Arachis hypogaea]XP_025648553.1 DEAD-box ATP-dependent RNA helicase 5 isoform X1 [Arachis hypogaea]XP_025648554.1 DEAD-box ATP-dependent RNA helicase 5 isoform X1 [Arachis hypogaea]XP_025648555.1 DEAD-box ATP-dependent RNA helicase 5 isoform X1 [Arachis hypogaea]XP_029147970.1 DEAD-box ATP-dependent RNA helicase 5 isoform X1 [Arachis hypogaea]XP_029147971.1 DE
MLVSFVVWSQFVCLYGGTSKGPQISSLKSGIDIVIGTPGCIQDLIEMGVCSLKDVSFVVVVGSEDLDANHDVMQIVEVLDDRAHDKRLVALLEKYHKSQRNRVLIFVLYKIETTRVERMLQQGGWKVVSIQGDKAQHDRTKALSLFKNGSCPLMGLVSCSRRMG